MHLKNDWTRAEIQALYQQPFLDLVFQAQQIPVSYTHLTLPTSDLV